MIDPELTLAHRSSGAVTMHSVGVSEAIRDKVATSSDFVKIKQDVVGLIVSKP